jgi:hypothetical protein
LQLALACFATALCIAERNFARDAAAGKTDESVQDTPVVHVSAAAAGPTLHP